MGLGLRVAVGVSTSRVLRASGLRVDKPEAELHMGSNVGGFGVRCAIFNKKEPL